MQSSSKKIALYASYQTGEDLPGYVRFALKHLAETDFHIVLLTNERPLSEATYEFLSENRIELFLTRNHGFDFGMYRRYLQLQANSASPINGSITSGIDTYNIERLLLLNDSIVYYQNRFAEFFAEAEKNPADAVSLTCSNEFSPHLQTYFLYMKQPALGAFYLHLFETPEQDTPQNLAYNIQYPLSDIFMDAGIHMGSIFQTEKTASFAYPELIKDGAGFVKRKLLLGSFTHKEKIRFLQNDEYDSLNADYASLVKSAGTAADFDDTWLDCPVKFKFKHYVDILWENAYRKVALPTTLAFLKIKKKWINKTTSK